MKKAAIIVINSGSTSLKFAVYEIFDQQLQLLAKGNYTGMPNNTKLQLKNASGESLCQKHYTAQVISHEYALEKLIPLIEEQFKHIQIAFAGHRLVSGGEKIVRAVKLDLASLEYLEQLTTMEPTHQHFEVMGAIALARIFPHIIQTASFDTSFHRSMPRVAEFYAVPAEISAKGVRHWGFHGISYAYISRQLAQLIPAPRKVIAAHLGGGASICAMLDGRSIDTSMQFGAITGLPMATRSGDFPADALLYLLREHHYSVSELDAILSKQSGLLALSGNLSSSMAEIEANNSASCQFARDMFDYMLLKYIGAYIAVLGGIDALVFSAGIGENDAKLRVRLANRLSWLGLELDQEQNLAAVGLDRATKISSPQSRVAVYVIPTNEELMIAQDTLALIQE